MEHYKSRNNDYFHFTNPHDDVSEFDDDFYDESQSYDVVDDDRSCDFNFHTYRPLTTGVMNQNDTVEIGGFDNGALVFQLDSRMKNISDKLQHTIEGIGTQISHLEDETCKIDNYVEDVKNAEERYHGATHRKLRQMQSVLQEVHDGVLFLRDKHEIAETRLQLAILRGSKRDEVNVSPQSPCRTPLFKQRSNELALQQAVSYHPVVTQAHEITAQQYIIPPNQQSRTPQYPHFVQSTLSNTSFIHTSNPRNYKSEFHAKYMPEFASLSNTHLHSEPSSYEISNVKPVDSFLHPQEESSGTNYMHTPVARTLPHALPTAIDVKEESRSDENGDTIPVDDIVDKVTSMGFRRDLVRACVRKLTGNGSRVDLNSVLDKMTNNK
ncbi:hypothetical protein HanRHA438_Chr16g0743491 [Helianthus annuus]|nr:hypothetical protein HanHA89_Chr16g0646461 [Helianthus annuus]KAJ0639783.1 hypothetical protein HanLR1_Chr16g0607601 [Helianthus annuus]KAJ0643733.1 hypothetical protein HanOQP8_Chr16g0603811 [Helianthus annuus]KAJ0819866.1 hypothetical protein HanPSC8_Chr16g0701021 [Helianthus annuus]KAJ0834425.1 hypothetical protein HanRHA438_Chr16g0743491 [Helianthus annuus]